MGEIWFYDASTKNYYKISSFIVDADNRLTGNVTLHDGTTTIGTAAGDLLVSFDNMDGVTSTTTIPGTLVHTTLVSKA